MAKYHFSREEIEARNRNFAAQRGQYMQPKPQPAPQQRKKRRRGYDEDDPDTFFGDPVMDELLLWDDDE